VGPDDPKNVLVPAAVFEGEPEITINPGLEDRPGAFYFLDPQRRMAGVGSQEANLLF
jgi:hypothetical protein